LPPKGFWDVCVLRVQGSVTSGRAGDMLVDLRMNTLKQSRSSLYTVDYSRPRLLLASKCSYCNQSLRRRWDN